MLAAWFDRVRPYEGIKIHTLEPKLECVKSNLQFVRSQKFYNYLNIGLI